jgi:hypothetical protein
MDADEADGNHAMTVSIETPRPPWRDEYLHDVVALERHAKEVAAWQRSSSDRFERADAELWSRVSASDACAIFLQLNELLSVWEASGQLNAAHAIENKARRESGLSPLSMVDFRVRLARVYFQFHIFNSLQAPEA